MEEMLGTKAKTKIFPVFEKVVLHSFCLINHSFKLNIYYVLSLNKEYTRYLL